MSGHAADRNLLFGIIAFQMDFITRDALIIGMNAWVLEKHRPLGEILVEQGALASKFRALLEPMVDAHVEGHGGTAASLSALTPDEPAISMLKEAIADPELGASIGHVGRSIPADSDATGTFVPRATRPAGSRYCKVRDHARGGLGVVFVARDEELNREVALKEIQGRHADDPDKRARFVVEAEITGRLEHPGIVPVYGLGHYDDGRPFYAMRFIKGDSLKDAIAAFHANSSRRDPGTRALDLQKLLRRFLDVCNAVEYAHSRGVLHRDLKPSNVMVGKYGETLVVDWGLAKATGLPDSDKMGLPTDSAMLTATSGSSPETLPGSVIGTPGYMSPEQAAGRLDLLGPASDVYSLGATLYTLLAGRTAFSGDHALELIRKIERGDFPRPSESSPWLDPALEAICLKAMALRPVDRYRSPRDLAGDVERWMADEPVTAYREPWTRRARRWARKHRTGLTTASATTAVAALLIGGFVWVRIAHRQETDTAARSTLAKAEILASEARTAGDDSRWEKAVGEALRARERLESGGGSLALRHEADARVEAFRAEQGRLRETLNAQRKDLEVVNSLEQARLDVTNRKDRAWDFHAMHMRFLAAFRAYGIDLATPSTNDASDRIRSSKVAPDLIAALDGWAILETDKVLARRLESIVRAADIDRVRTSIRDALARGDSAAVRRFCETEEDRRKLGPRVRLAFTALLVLDPAGSLPLLETIVRENPSDFWLNYNLGLAYHDARPPRHAEAVRYISVAVALRPDSTAAHINLGNALLAEGKLDQAIHEYREAIRLKPDDNGARVNLGVALITQGRIDQGIVEYREAIRREPDNTGAHVNLGSVLYTRGDFDQAIAEYREAVRLNPNSAEAHTGLGNSLLRRGEIDRGIAEYREAVRLNPDYSGAHYNLGDALRVQGQTDEAIAEIRETIRLDPEFADAHCNLGMVLRNQGRFREALKLLERGHALGSRRTDWPHPSEEWVREVRRMVELEPKALAILKGEATPRDASERLALADFCYQTRRYATSARFWDEAFAERPATADDMEKQHRYSAACSASLAGSGSGKDEPMPDEAARIKLREKALGWLRADLAAWSKDLDRGHAPDRKQATAKTLAHWKEDSDLAGIRDEAALVKRPETEQRAFRALWADVEALRKKAEEATKATSPD